MSTLTAQSTVNSKYQVVIPKVIREKYKLQPRKKVLISADEYGIYIFQLPNKWGAYLQGLGKEMWEKVGGGDNYLKKERTSWD